MSQTSAWDMEKALQILKGKGMNPSMINVELQYVEPGAFEGIVLPGA